MIGTPPDPQLAEAVAKLRAWVADGAHRRDRDGDGVYEHAEAIRIMDALVAALDARAVPALARQAAVSTS